MAKTIDITDRATPFLQELRKGIAVGDLNRAMAAGAVKLIKGHFKFLYDSRPNKFGAKRTGFWADAARSTSDQSKPGEILITIAKLGFRQRLQGGVIRPTGGRKYLTLPARAEAYGKRASEFNDLEVIFNKARQPIGLAQTNRTRVKFGRTRKDGSRKVSDQGGVGGLVFFWLKKSVTQRPDPSVLPADEQIAAACIDAGKNYLLGVKGKS